eukprot:TRINITY_DN652_c0_g2_i1.p1 TRINITY_DN652_c0_g2~~TRINITY_DN652_c0_g2_i1.p1  ORF type:complete len:509 (-),score=106.85 TRINITY_DN652_c0_g2_i1:2534-4060(-)
MSAKVPEWKLEEGQIAFEHVEDKEGVLPMLMDFNHMTFKGLLDFSVKGDDLGLKEDFNIELRLKYERWGEEKTFYLDGEASQVTWQLDEINAQLALGVRAGWSGPFKNFTAKDIAIAAKGCGFGVLPFKIGSGQTPGIYMQGKFAGTINDGFDWAVAGGIRGLAIESWMTDSNVLFTYSKADGIEVAADATLQFSLPGVPDPIDALVTLEYNNEDGFSVEANVTAQVTPVSWGLSPANISIKYEREATPKVHIVAEINGTIVLGKIIPGVKANVDVKAKLETGEGLYIEGVSQFNLPQAVGGYQTLVTMTVDSSSGMNLIGTAKVDKKLIDLPEAINKKGIGDLKLDQVTLVGGMPWEAFRRNAGKEEDADEGEEAEDEGRDGEEEDDSESDEPEESEADAATKSRKRRMKRKKTAAGPSLLIWASGSLEQAYGMRLLRDESSDLEQWRRRTKAIIQPQSMALPLFQKLHASCCQLTVNLWRRSTKPSEATWMTWTKQGLAPAQTFLC